MIEVIRQRGVNLPKRKMGMLKMNLIRAPTVCDVVQDNFDDLHICVVNPRPPLSVKVNVARCVNCIHGFILLLPPRLLQICPKHNAFHCIPFAIPDRASVALCRTIMAARPPSIPAIRPHDTKMEIAPTWRRWNHGLPASPGFLPSKAGGGSGSCFKCVKMTRPANTIPSPNAARLMKNNFKEG